MRTVIKGGLVVSEQGHFKGDVLIEDGKIAEIGNYINTGDQVIDAAGKIVIPGGVDVHTHFNLHVGNMVANDDFYTGTAAAACGGTTCIVDHMGFGPENCSLHHQVDVYHGYADGNAVIDYGFHGVIQHVDENILNEMKSIIEDDGIPSFKIYLTYDYKISDGDVFRVMRKLKELNGMVTVHPENDEIVNLLRKEFIGSGSTSPIFHALSRPSRCEGEAVNRMVDIAYMAGNAPLYIVHLTCEEGLLHIEEAQRRGQKVYAETCPQYLLLDEDMYKREDGLKFIMSPPLREKSNQNALWNGINKGSIQVVATDHCPFSYEYEKQLGKGDFTKCPNGVPGVEERLPLMFSEGVMKGRISLNRFVEVCSTNPARIFGLYPQKGVIAPGSDGDIVIIDPEKQVTLTRSILHGRADYTAYEGMKIKGYPVLTMLRGGVIFKDGEFIGNKGQGRYIRRKAYMGNY